MLKKFWLIIVATVFAYPLTAQSAPSAEARNTSLWVGASFSTFNPDYGCSSNSPFSCWDGQLLGISPYADTKSFLLGRVGAEAQARFLYWHGPSGLSETTYMAGPRARLFRYKGFSGSGKILFGGARFHVAAPAVGSGNYFAFAPGFALDRRIARRWSLRVDYEYQRWPSFSGLQAHGLTPNGLSIGASYAVF